MLVPYFSDICQSRGAEILIGKGARDAGVYIDEQDYAFLDEEGGNRRERPAWRSLQHLTTACGGASHQGEAFEKVIFCQS